nr:hypothetical protein CTI12_AA240690 [Tanacetum cinerariifolium]
LIHEVARPEPNIPLRANLGVLHTSMGVVGNTGVGIASSKDGIAIAETCNLNEKGIAGSGTSNEHTSMEDVVNTSCVFSSTQDGFASYKGGSDFEFGKVKSFDGILKNPPNPLFSAHIGKNTTNNPFVSKPNDGGVWNNKRKLALKMEYVPASVSKLKNGNIRISFSIEEVFKGGQVCLYSFMVILWEPGIWLTKTEPSSIPIWVCVYNIPLELCNGNGIGKIMSGVGKPLLMDKMTRERCLKKAGKMDFARVLVEVSVEDDLPNVIEIKYPPLGNRPSRIGMLEVKYKWRPPLCTHCKTFGHSTLSCNSRPRTDDEIATNTVKEAINVNGSGVTVSSSDLNDGFVFVGKKNKPVNTQNRSASVNYNKSNFYGMRGKGVDNGRRQLAGNQKQYRNGQVFNDSGNFRRNIQGNNANRQMSKNYMGLKNSDGNAKHNNGVEWQKKNSKSNTGNGFA